MRTPEEGTTDEAGGVDRPPLRLLISGSTGLIGRRLVAARRAAGDEVVRLVRKATPAADEVVWNPGGEGALNSVTVSGFDAVIHLAGESVAGLWTERKKRRIKDSRVKGTAVLARALAGVEQPPPVFVCASGINFYGDRGDAVVDETTPRGSGFLPDVCATWESAAAPLQGRSRIVQLRIGVVLAPEGGMLGTMLPLFRRGLGGSVGDGRGYVSWVTLDDLVRVVGLALQKQELAGPVNVCTPNPVTQAAFTQALAAAVGRPAWIRVPGWAARLLLGQMADETVLGSVRAMPRRLLDAEFRFLEATLPEAFAACGVGRR